MKFADFIVPGAIRAELAAEDKEGVIREMVQALLDAGGIEAKQFESIIKEILKREGLGSTGIGRGVAVPHTKHPAVDKLVGTVAVSGEGVDFESLDGEKCDLFSPPGLPARPARGPLAGPGKDLPPAPRRHLLPFPQAGQDGRRDPAALGRGRQQPVRLVTAAHRL